MDDWTVLLEKRVDGVYVTIASAPLVDESRDDWLGAIEKDELTWIQVSDLKGSNNEAARLYGINSIPSKLLLDRHSNQELNVSRGEGELF